MIDKLKGLVYSQYELWKKVEVVVDERNLMESSNMMDEIVCNITFMYDFCTIDLDQASS
jgi:hypothetical protein